MGRCLLMGKIVVTKLLMSELTGLLELMVDRIAKTENRISDLEFKNEALEDKVETLENDYQSDYV